MTETALPLAEDGMFIPAPLRILISQAQLATRIRELAGEINALYQGTDELVIICILKGGFMFASELVRHLTVPCQMEFVRLSSYGHAHKSSGVIKPVDLTLPPLAGKDVLLVEDIVDTGLTLNFFMEYLESVHAPRSARLAVLLDKKEARQQAVEMDFVGFEIDNRFVVGFGLDDQGFYRNLPYIAYVPQSGETQAES